MVPARVRRIAPRAAPQGAASLESPRTPGTGRCDTRVKGQLHDHSTADGDQRRTLDDSGAETLTITDNRTGTSYELPIADGTIRATDLRQIKVDEDDFGLMTYDPAFMNTASCRSAITYLDGDAGHPPLPRLPHRAARREEQLPRGGLPAGVRRSADPGAARRLGTRHHPPHVRPREREGPDAGLPLRRPPDGDAAVERRGAQHLLPRGQGHRRTPTTATCRSSG